MARRVPTAEQKQKAAERRERFAALAKEIAALSEDDRAALVTEFGAVVTVEGRALSTLNTCLVLTQLPTASMVGGFRQWKAHGRSVKKGEHGLMIWVPTSRTDKAEDGAPIAEGDSGEGKGKRSGFVMGTVFDVSQTEPSTERGGINRERMDALAQDMADVGSL